MHLKPAISVLAVSLLVFAPGLPLVGTPDAGAAFANNGNGNGGGGGNGNSGGNGGGSGKDKSESQNSKSGKSETAVKKTKKPADAVASSKATKAAKVDDGKLSPSELGKMNGALHANINAVLAHIRNGQTTNGPVGLLAGLAVADAGAAGAAAKAAELEQLAKDFDALNTALADEGFESPEEYLQAKADGTLTLEQIALIDPLIEDVGGTDETGLALENSEPTDEEIQQAKDAADGSDAAVTEAEQAILDAWNKDGDAEALLADLRARLVPYQSEIDAAVAETQATEESAALP